MTTQTSSDCSASDREIVSSRILNAAPASIFEAYADGDRLARWWGPDGFTNTFHEFEFRPGGAWRFVMHGPDGTNYDNHSVFAEVEPAKRIVLNHLTEPKFCMVHTLDDLGGGRTQLSWRMRFETAADCEAVRPYVPACNEQNFDRLEAELAKTR